MDLFVWPRHVVDNHGEIHGDVADKKEAGQAGLHRMVRRRVVEPQRTNVMTFESIGFSPSHALIPRKAREFSRQAAQEKILHGFVQSTAAAGRLTSSSTRRHDVGTAHRMAWNNTTLSDDGIPLWFQIAAILRTAVSAGEFRPGEALPSEAELYRVFGVSRTTARSSLDKLEQEGLIVRRSGRGSIVLEPRVEQPLNLLGGFSEDMRRRGLTPSYHTLSAAFVEMSKDIQEALNIRTRRKAYRIHRLLKANNSLIASSTSWLAPSVLDKREPPSPEELNGGSLYAWLEERCAVRLTGGEEIIEARAADTDIAALLDVMIGAPILVATRTSRSEAGEAVEHAVIVYRADRYRFRLDLATP